MKNFECQLHDAYLAFEPSITTADYEKAERNRGERQKWWYSTVFTMKMPVFTVSRKAPIQLALYLLIHLLNEAFSRSRTLMRFL